MTATGIFPKETISRHRLLIVEDDPDTRRFLVRALGAEEREVCEAQSGAEAMQLLRLGGPFDLILTDVVMPNGDGFSVMAEARRCQPEARVVLLTAFGDVEEYLDAMDRGAFEYLTKPVKLPELRRVVDRALAPMRIPPSSTVVGENPPSRRMPRAHSPSRPSPMA